MLRTYMATSVQGVVNVRSLFLYEEIKSLGIYLVRAMNYMYKFDTVNQKNLDISIK